jgi:hypothetical protein
MAMSIGSFVFLSPPSKDSFVESGKQTIENCAIRVEKFVEEHKVGFWQHTLCIGNQVALTQLSQVEWTEQLAGLGKASQ